MTEYEWLNTFADNLARMMYESKLTQQDLSRMTDISIGSISKYLNRQQIPGVRAILSLAYAFGCSTDDLIDFGTPINDF